jgi:hypothetical protein
MNDRAGGGVIFFAYFAFLLIVILDQTGRTVRELYPCYGDWRRAH